MKMIRKRIGYLSGDFFDFGGVETHLLSILRLLNKDQFDCLLIASASLRFVEQIEAAGARYIPPLQKRLHLG